jgi:hypothetical protein
MFGFAKKRTLGDTARRHMDVILWMCVHGGADKIIFGEPCDDLPRETLQGAMASNRGLAKLIGLRDELCPKAKDVPMWQRVHGTWHELAGIPWHLLHEVIRNLGDRSVAQDVNEQLPDSLESIVPLKWKGGSVKVAMRLSLEPNYCYSITLKKID